MIPIPEPITLNGPLCLVCGHPDEFCACPVQAVPSIPIPADILDIGGDAPVSTVVVTDHECET